MDASSTSSGDEPQLRAELSSLKVMQLHERALAAGCAEGAVEDCMDAPNCRQALVELLMTELGRADAAATGGGDRAERPPEPEQELEQEPEPEQELEQEQEPEPEPEPELEPEPEPEPEPDGLPPLAEEAAAAVALPEGVPESLPATLRWVVDMVTMMQAESKADKERLRKEAAAEKAELVQKLHRLNQQMKADFDARIRELMDDAEVTEAIPEAKLVALQKRISALHTAQLLTDDEVSTLEDLVGDWSEAKGGGGVMTLEMLPTHPACAVASTLLKLIGVSEGVVSDAALARQLRRKFLS